MSPLLDSTDPAASGWNGSKQDGLQKRGQENCAHNTKMEPHCVGQHPLIGLQAVHSSHSHVLAFDTLELCACAHQKHTMSSVQIDPR